MVKNLFQDTIDNIMVQLDGFTVIEATMLSADSFPIQVQKIGDYYMIQNMNNKGKAYFTRRQVSKELLKIDMFSARKIRNCKDNVVKILDRKG